jgi:hypothetical protein
LIVTYDAELKLRGVLGFEAPIVTSFTRMGYEARRLIAGWTCLDDYGLTGRVIVLTGAASGLGYARLQRHVLLWHT